MHNTALSKYQLGWHTLYTLLYYQEECLAYFSRDTSANYSNPTKRVLGFDSFPFE